MNELTYTVKGACKLTNLGPTTIYQALNDGALLGKKVGRRTLITSQSLQQWLDSLPGYAPKGIVQQQ
jgi:excisionase family DNA binding protein